MKKYLYSLLVIVSLLMVSCNPEDYFNPVIEIDLPEHKPKLVVHSEMWEGQDSLLVFVTQSRGALDNKKFPTVKDSAYYIWNKDTTWYINIYESADLVENAKVELFKNDVLLTTFSKKNQSGFHFANLSSPLKQDGATYRLRVSAPGFESIEAIQQMPSAVKIDTVTYRPQVKLTDPNDPLTYTTKDEFFIEFQDPPSEKNFYVAEGFYYEKTGRDSFLQYLNFYSLDPLSVSNYLSDQSFNGKKGGWRQHTYSTGKPSGSQYTIYLASLSEAYYLYYQSLNRYWNATDNPFAEPVVLYTNVKNGYGLFSMGTFRSYTFKSK